MADSHYVIEKSTKDNRTITDIIIENLPDEDRKQFLSIRSPKKLMFAKVKIMKQFVTVGMLLGLWVGLSDLLKRMNVLLLIIN